MFWIFVLLEERGNLVEYLNDMPKIYGTCKTFPESWPEVTQVSIVLEMKIMAANWTNCSPCDV